MAVSLAQAWLNFAADNRGLQQFGQGDDESTFNGSTGCTHSILQRLIKAKTGKYYTHDQISQIAGYPSAPNNPKRRGLYSGGDDNEVGRVIAHFGLPYRIAGGYTYDTIRRYVNSGPVMIGVRYGWWPEWRGYRYGGRYATGVRNGFSIRNGSTQLAGSSSSTTALIYHAVLWLPGVQKVYSTYRTNAHEPNHASAARPERPDYDTVGLSQIKAAYEAYGFNIQGSGSRKRLAWVPTAVFRPRGY